MRVVILTGAGVSAESGLGTFRDKDGIWTRVNLDDVATPEGFARDPDMVHAFYNQRRTDLKTAQPNPAHDALARLESALQARSGAHEDHFAIVTQNIDNLHESAGSKNVVHMHGELTKGLCANCGWSGEWLVDMETATPCPQCADAGIIRPDVVWFGEVPYHMDKIFDLLAQCDLFVSIGTSGNVYPAAAFVSQVRAVGAVTMELNLEPSENAHEFDDAIYGPASEVVPDWVERLLALNTSQR